jgi:hypothetical protein
MKFIYESFDIEGGRIAFHFTMGEYHFTPEWRLPFALPAENPAVRRALFNLGMAELVSYWKSYCPKEIVIRAGYLSDNQRAWWKKLYLGGLGEFFYRNGITQDDNTLHITCDCDCDVKPRYENKNAGNPLSGILIPVGGGKDSAVTMMKLGSDNNLAYCINPSGSALATARVAGFADEKIIIAKRTIDPLLLELNRRGALNGHTPFSAVVAFSSFLIALIMNKQYIALSNESSADESYVSGKAINHQYSKGTGFESDFRDYIAGDFAGFSESAVPEYFSFLRPYNEWRIAEAFVTDKRFLPVFLSCNLGAKQNKWCGRCAKCLYTYALLAAFLPDEELIPIFGRNLLDDEGFAGMFAALLDPQKDKPWECVGTREEINHAVFAARRLRTTKGEKLPFLLREFTGAENKAVETYFNDAHFVPDRFLPLLLR